MSKPIEKVLRALGDRVKRQRGKVYDCLCPAHSDARPSLTVTEAPSGKVLLCCQSQGCSAQAIVAALGLQMSDLFVPDPKKPQIAATYDYKDANGVTLYQSVGMIPKDFRVRQPLGGDKWKWSLEDVEERVPYRLPELLAQEEGVEWLVVEGESDADKLWQAGFAATTTISGAGKFYPTYARHFAGRNVTILPDNDVAGENHAKQVAETLHGTAASIRILRLPGLPDKGDVSDWLAAGGTADDLAKLIEDAPAWEPVAEPDAVVVDG